MILLLILFQPEVYFINIYMCNTVIKPAICQAKLNKMQEINLNSYLVNKHFTMVNIFEYLILYKAI